MDNNKLQQVAGQNQSIVLSKKEVEIAKEVYYINHLVSFPLADFQIDEWARTINELRPDVTPQNLKEIIDGMKQGYIDFDSRLGIQNIFKALDAGKIYLPMTN